MSVLFCLENGLVWRFIAILTVANSVRSQEKDGDMILWINRCTLKVNWTIQTKLDGCVPNLYSVRLLKNNQEIATSDTTLTSYSFEGTDSESTYRVIVSPILECNNGSRPRGNSLDHSISAIPRSQQTFITKYISDDFTLQCPLNGSYTPFSVEWEHKIGIDSTIVRKFTTPEITLTDVSYKDSGKYVCTVGFYFCGGSGLLRKLTSSVSLNLNGPPYIPMPQQTVVADPADNLTLSLSLISFPAPFSLVLVRNQNNEIIHRSSVSFAPTEVKLSAFGRVVTLYGYSCRLNMPNITREWFGTNSIIVFNRLGNYSFSFIVEEFSDKENSIENNRLQDSAAEGNQNQHTYVQTFSFESNGQNEGKCKQNSDLEIKVTRNAFLKMFFKLFVT
nr:uncharacterized protein LOC105328044 isoform X7 [Crassostrea gigas]